MRYYSVALIGVRICGWRHQPNSIILSLACCLKTKEKTTESSASP